MSIELNQPIKLLRKTKPLILCLTNFVTMDLMANGLLALGAAPVMSFDSRESEDLIKISGAINLNMGTLSDSFVSHAIHVCRLAKKYHKPIIFDAVGAGASHLRTAFANEILSYCNIVRGNSSEIIALDSSLQHTLGVESTHCVHEAMTHAKQLALQYNATIVVSGSQDFITNGSEEATVNDGSALMTLVTGMGCLQGAVIAAFHAIEPCSFKAAIMGASLMGKCGQSTASITSTPGTFRTTFIDRLYDDL